MAPIALNNDRAMPNIEKLKSKLEDSRNTTRPPVPDNFMYDFDAVPELPTIDRLGIDIEQDAEASLITAEIVEKLEAACAKGDGEAFAALFLEEGKSEGRAF